MVSVPRFLRATFFLPAALLLMAVVATGCTDNHIGRACEVIPGAETQPPPTTTGLINSAALECPSRICVLPAAQRPGQTTGPTCSAECSSDSDCDNSEMATKGDNTDRRCQGSYYCRVATNLGGFACRKLCLCSDFINIPEVPGPCKPQS